MTFEELVDQVIAMLERRGRVICRALKRQLQLDDDVLEDLTAEILRLVEGWVRVIPRRAFPPSQPSPASKGYNDPPAQRVPNRMAQGKGHGASSS
jgi:hypothetical protein